MRPRTRQAFFSAAVLTALAAVLAVVLPAGTASAAGRPAAETHVRASPLTAPERTAAGGPVAADQRLGEAAACPFYAHSARVAPEADPIAGMVSRIDPENLNMTRTVANHLGDYLKDGRMARPYMNSPLTIREIIKGGTPVLDPGGVPGALRWDVAGGFRGSAGTWQLVIDTDTNTILHFNFVSGR